MGTMNSSPYKISYLKDDDGTELICALGPQRAINRIVLAGGQVRRMPDNTKFAVIPASRTNAMIVESMGIPSFASPEYRSLRDRLMAVDSVAKSTWVARLEPAIKPPISPARHQRDFCASFFDKRGMLNGSEQGTGKSLMAIMLQKAWGHKRNLVVTGKSLIWQWHGMFHEYLQEPGDPVPLEGTIKSKVDALRGFGGMDTELTLIVNYEVLSHLLPAFTSLWRPEHVVFDESWRLDNPKADVTKAAYAIVDMCKHVQLLNGSPFNQDGSRLWSQLRLLSDCRGEDMEPFADFRERYCECIDMNLGRYSIRKPIDVRDPAGLMQRIAPHFFRATKATSLDLPEKLKPVRVRVTMPSVASRLYRAVLTDGDAVFNPMSLAGDRVSAIREAQVTSGYTRPVGSEEYSKITPGGLIDSGKLKWCTDYARDILLGDPTYRVIVWFRFNNSLFALAEELGKIIGAARVGCVTSATTSKQLEAMKLSFNSRDPEGIQVILGQQAKLAYGHNLQACDWNILYDHSWRYLERDQLEDRSHRMGRVGPVGYTELEAMFTDAEGKVKPTIDRKALEAFEKREDFATRFSPDTTSGLDEDELAMIA